MKNILLVDDEKELIELIELYLENENIKIFRASDGIEALNIIKCEDIDLAVVDIMMPNMNGYQLIKATREEYQFPIIVLSARTDVHDKILSLNLGADDFMTKPFNTLELIARIKSHIRRSNISSVKTMDTTNLKCRDLRLNIDNCTLFKEFIEIELTSLEIKILKFFFENLDKVLTKKQIFEAAWNENYYGDENAVRVHLSNLRDKLDSTNKTYYIKTLRGLGYKMKSGE